MENIYIYIYIFKEEQKESIIEINGIVQRLPRYYGVTIAFRTSQEGSPLFSAHQNVLKRYDFELLNSVTLPPPTIVFNRD